MKEIIKLYEISNFGSISFQHINTFNTKSLGKLPDNSKSVLMLIFPYYSKTAFCGNISGYCSVKDYHLVVMKQLKSIILELKKLYPLEAFVPFVDASPIDEVDAAVKAGLGVRGKNGLLITQNHGSFVFIGEIVSTVKLEDVLFEEKDCCGCGLCSAKCPGKCIDDGKINSNLCASFISQKKQELTTKQVQILKKADTVFGCDICQLVCPHNKGVLLDNLTSNENLFTFDILNTITAENVESVYKSRAFGFRGLKVLQRNLQIYNSDKEGLFYL